MIDVKEGSYLNEDIVTVQMDVPKDEWEKIRSSAEWQRIITSDIGNDNQFKLADEVDKTIKSVCETVQSKDLTPGEYADTVKALAALVEARAKLI